ncbi:MAG: Fe-S cluster assembly protein SufD [Verrucomicrobiota bacterium]|jgi:Fe-S cluster assembly protein SufD|nr:Fe-S cluster assembly protein SufD [Verrucomicrobiota bacterium]MDP6251990.1 Fe-S cluster assembly protein SufD [Verrucomicrobiota bacterium]MDP7176884.1 Fe-S cluster assembly protein SufD [Verrucomicrobiota bacterium]MDP7291645.1 Fe-S cluster assembly protein SufD [Verrucomicrobiota bacterium]MDP7441291.1 Fe-S cluster assembly protein SufD [Verrucomicrobiota bacterium]|tara:strand:- start:6431 stop:7735 length:1305 start_codon:yes stop_codon:yes gene_type:complete
MSNVATTDPATTPVEAFVQLEQNGVELMPLRKAGLARFSETGYPTLRDEDWRFTNVKPLTELPFRPVTSPFDQTPGLEQLGEVTFGCLDADRLVFVDGHFKADLSQIADQSSGVTVSNLAHFEGELGSLSGGDDNPFVALNDAFFTDGAVIQIGDGQHLAKPVHLLFVTMAGEDGEAAHVRNWIVAGANSHGTIIESHLSLGQAATVTNVVTETRVGNGANVEHVKFQDQSAKAFHLASLHSELGRDARYAFHSIALGARLSRNNLRLRLAQPGTECVLNGLYMTRGQQLADHHMIVDHAAPHCDSHEYFNGLLDDQSRGVFHGRILVQPGAQKTNAKQTNKNLLLSDDATANTKPQLEIYADDVKCTHGATVGELDADAVFYLRTRGLDACTARRMLMHGFAGEIVERIRHDAAREELDALVWNRLEAKHQLD